MRLAIIFASLGFTNFSWAQENSKDNVPSIKVPVSHGLNTDVFEKEEGASQEAPDKLKKMTAKVKVVREESDGVEVFFEGDKNAGAFYLYRAIPHYSKALSELEKSKKPQGPAVTISYTEDKKIKTVEIKKDDIKIMPTDPNEKWDFEM